MELEMKGIKKKGILSDSGYRLKVRRQCPARMRYQQTRENYESGADKGIQGGELVKSFTDNT